MIALLDFKLAYFDAVVQLVNHYFPSETSDFISFFIQNTEIFLKSGHKAWNFEGKGKERKMYISLIFSREP